MSSLLIPQTGKLNAHPILTKENVPAALLSHNTAAGVFGQLCVAEER